MKLKKIEAFVSRIKEDVLKKIKKYKILVCVVILLGIGCLYKIRTEENVSKMQFKAVDDAVVGNAVKASSSAQSRKTVFINTNLYGKPPKERKKYLLENHDMDSFVKNNGAKVTIIDYSSFVCSFCKGMREDMNKIIKEYVLDKQIMNYVLRPVYNRKTIPLGAFLLCMKDEDRLKIAEDFFKINIDETTDFDTLLVDVAQKYGINEDYVKDCIHDEGNYERIIYMQTESKNTFDLRGTPVLIVNGKQYTGYRNYEQIKHIVEEAIEKNVP
ncbi:MAG: DsbA family protein [Rickettsiales bacterium]|jgi:protein-disulfide isomerase|nr:DsbA family protein [Rickettsiales bacterium]